MRYLITVAASSVIGACTISTASAPDATDASFDSTSEWPEETSSSDASGRRETSTRPQTTNVRPTSSDNESSASDDATSINSGATTSPTGTPTTSSTSSTGAPTSTNVTTTPDFTTSTNAMATSESSRETSTEPDVSTPREGCEDGPLDAPIPGCAPTFEETGDYYADCVERINQFRWECQCLPPLERNEEGEDCADQQSQYDYEQDEAHAGARKVPALCQPNGHAQNECPGYGGRFGIVDFCLQQMWDEGPGEDFNAHGHYINMSSLEFSSVACGTYTTPEGEIWAVQNFFR